MSDAYEYICEDKSVLYLPLKKYLWAPLVAKLPLDVSPNTLTLAGSFFAWVAFTALLLLNPSNSLWFLLPAAANFLYLSLDNMDGMQARRAGRSSALGEFLDHWADGFNIALVVFGFGVAMNAPAWFLVPMLWLGTMTCYACFWEQQVTGKLNFGATGANEGIMYTIVMYLLVVVFGHDAIATRPLLFGQSFSNLTLFISFACTVVQTVAGSMWRVRSRRMDFIAPVLLFAVSLLWTYYGNLPVLAALFLIMFGGAYLSGRLVVARVLRQPFQTHDPLLYGLLIAGLTVAVGARFSASVSTYVVSTILFYLTVRLGMDFRRTVLSLKHQLNSQELLARIMIRRIPTYNASIGPT